MTGGNVQLEAIVAGISNLGNCIGYWMLGLHLDVAMASVAIVL